MDESSLRRLLLARACEETDPAGRFVTQGARSRATRAAAERAPEDGAASPQAAEEYLVARADALLEEAAREHPGLAGAEHAASALPPLWLVVAVALALGVGVDALGGRRAVNLLAFPLLGILLWNLGVLVASAAGGGRVAASPPALLRFGRRLRTRFARVGESGDRGFVAGALARFAALWWEAAGPLESARLQLRLHAGAAAFALGVVLGMYVAGFAFEYRATWESTFLDAAQVRGFLGVVLGPASALLGLPLPDVSGIAALEAPDGGDAAPWIHRWALTALLFVGLPRIALAFRQAAAARGAAASLAPDLEAPGFARLLAAFRGEGADVRVLTYSHELAPGAATRLHELLHELFGSRASFGFEAPLAYGDAPPTSPASAPEATLLVFHLAQSHLRATESMYIVDPYRHATYRGWRTSATEVHRFYFTHPADSYAEAFDDSSAMGVIAIAAYRERRPEIRPDERRLGKESAPGRAKPGAPGIATGEPAESYDDAAGTGFGERHRSRSVRVHFDPEPSPFARRFLKYEWRETLVEMGVIPARDPNRFWPNRFWPTESTREYAPYPPGYR